MRPDAHQYVVGHVETTHEKQSAEEQSLWQMVSALTSAIATVIARHRDGLRLELISNRMTDNIRVWTGVWEAEMIGFQQMSEGWLAWFLSKHFSFFCMFGDFCCRLCPCTTGPSHSSTCEELSSNIPKLYMIEMHHCMVEEEERIKTGDGRFLPKRKQAIHAKCSLHKRQIQGNGMTERANLRKLKTDGIGVDHGYQRTW